MSTDTPFPRNDRRKDPRVKTELSGSLERDGRTQCRILNISRSGALAISTEPLPEMAQVQIRLNVDLEGTESESICCEAAVVRCTRRPDGNYDVGLFFTRIPEGGAEMLDQIIEKQSLTSGI